MTRLTIPPAVLDLSPVQGMPLTKIGYTATTRKSASLDALRGMPLEQVSLGGSGIHDLSALEGMRLVEFELSFSKVTDLAPIRDARLEKLRVRDSPVSSVEPLRGMLITDMSLSAVPLTDIGPLEGMPLKSLTLMIPVSDLRPLRSAPLEYLSLVGATDVDLSHLADSPLRELRINQIGQLADISALRHLPLERLTLNSTAVVDLSPIADLPLTYLRCNACQVEDLTPLKNMKLTEVYLPCNPIRDFSPLQTLTGIDESKCPWVPFLCDRITTEQFFERMPEKERGYSWVIVGMKQDSDSNLPEAVKAYEEANRIGIGYQDGLWILRRIKHLKKQMDESSE